VKKGEKTLLEAVYFIFVTIPSKILQIHSSYRLRISFP